MSGWVAGSVVIGAGASAYTAHEAGKDVARAGSLASKAQGTSDAEALAYLKESEALPQQYRDEALGSLAGVYGLPGGVGSQEEQIQMAMQSPLYQQLMGGREAGEEAILRSASATGGLRSGDVQSNLYDYNTQLQNQSLLQAYNQQIGGLTGLAGTPTNAMPIANQMNQMGTNQAQGIMAQGQQQQQGYQQYADIFGSALGQLGPMASNYASRPPAGLAQAPPPPVQTTQNYSDRRLKKNIKKLGKVKGFNWYEWDWNTVANKMGLSGSSCGVLADEIHKTNPDCISILNRFMAVDYRKLLGEQNA